MMPGRWYDMRPQHWRTIVLSAILLGALYACIVAAVLMQVTKGRPLPFRYDDITLAGSYPRLLCPGDRLRFDLRITVTTAPSAVLVVENWQSVDGPSIADLSPAYHIQEATKVAEVTQSIPIPNLTPGGWVYERAASVNTVDHPALLQIPFTVKADCS
ncbi:MAG: hypothetical protein R2932_59215 [Caldilineaceae bacterium]